MRKILLNLILTLGLTFTLISQTGVAFAASDPTACPDPSSSTGQVLSGIGESESQNGGAGNCDTSAATNITGTAVSILSLVVGAAAVIMIMVGGFKYITSGGDANKVGNAKNTLVYALIGLVIAVLAQLLVHYVIFKASSIVGLDFIRGAVV
jgi:hypothetical protein